MTLAALYASFNGLTVTLPAGTRVGHRYVAPVTPGQEGYYVDVLLEQDVDLEVKVRAGTLAMLAARAAGNKGGEASGGPVTFKVRKGRKA